MPAPLLPAALLAALLLTGAAAPGSPAPASPSAAPAGLPTAGPSPAGLPSPGLPPPGLGDTIYPALGSADINVTHYDLTLSTDPAQDVIQGRAVLNVTARRPISRLGLDLLGPVVSAAQVNGRAAPFSQRAGRLSVTLPAPLAAGTTFTLAVTYAGTPGLLYDTSEEESGALRLGWIAQNGSVYTLSEPDGARTFFPVNDHPSDGASYSLHLSVPQGYAAVASGTLTGSRSVGGRTVSDFELPQPIPSYALAVQIGRLEVVRGSAGPTARRDAYPAGAPDSLRAPFARTARMLEVLGDWFGPYPFAVYGAGVTADPGIPALETATLSTFPARPTRETTALHELAHQWFGDTLRLADWSQVWLNEGFATYAELLWAQANGNTGEGMVAGWYSALERLGTRPLIATQSRQLFDSSSYFRGALALHALRLQTGDARFRQMLRLYVSRFSGQAVATADFLGVVREVGGPEAVAAIRPWIEDRGLPPRPE